MLFTRDLSFPEAPVLLPDGSWLVTEMGPERGCVTQISHDGRTKRAIAKTGRPNGLAVDRNGNIWVAESLEPALLLMTLAGTVKTVMTECDGEPFLFPNDLCFGPDGALYLTDSGILLEEIMPGGKVRADWSALPVDGRVYRIDVKRGSIEKLASGLRFSNGIVFGADNHLYVAESLTGCIYRFALEKTAKQTQREYFGNVKDPEVQSNLKAPDGMAFGENGRLYVTVFGQGDVTVLDSQGQVVDRIRTQGRLPTNLAFGPRGSRKIFVTEDEYGQMEVFDVPCDGFRLYN